MHVGFPKSYWNMKLILCFLLLVTAGILPTAFTQEPADKPLQQVKIRLSEYRLTSAEAFERTDEELLNQILAIPRSKDASLAVLAERVVFTHLIGSKSSVQFGRQVGLVTGQSIDARGLTTQNINYREVGTIVEVASNPTDQPETIRIELEYSASHLDPVTGDTPPEISNCRIKSQIMVKKGKPILLLGKADADNVALVLSVE